MIIDPMKDYSMVFHPLENLRIRKTSEFNKVGSYHLASLSKNLKIVKNYSCV